MATDQSIGLNANGRGRVDLGRGKNQRQHNNTIGDKLMLRESTSENQSEKPKPTGDDQPPTYQERELSVQRDLLEQTRDQLTQTRKIVGRLLVSNDELRASDGMKSRVLGDLLQRQNQSQIHIDELQRNARDMEPRLTTAEGDINDLRCWMDSEIKAGLEAEEAADAAMSKRGGR